MTTKVKEDYDEKEKKLIEKKRKEQEDYLTKIRGLPISEQRKLEDKKRA